MTSSTSAHSKVNKPLSLLSKKVKMRFKDANPKKVTLSKISYRCYSPTAMTNAYRAVIENNMPVKKAAVSYGVPQTTLRQRVLGRVDPEATSSGPNPELSQEQESVFVEHLKSMASLGYGYTSSELVSMASNYAVFLGKRDEQHPFGTKWYRGFLKRWPELHVVKPRSLVNYRAKAASESNVTEYFERLNSVLIKHDLKDKPHCIYNVDEKGIQTEHVPPFVVSSGNYTPAITSSRSSITTKIGCGNAVGTMMPPFYIFKGKRFNADLLSGSSAGATGVVTDSGWSTSKSFQTFLENHFIKYIQRGSEDQTVLLIFDGHRSHINIPVIDWAKKHNIELFVLPAHTNHILQPLDVACFGPLQRIYNSECHRFIRTNPYSNITRFNVAELSSKAYETALSVSNLRAAFKRTGIFPFDPSAINHEVLVPATVYTESPSDKDPVTEVCVSSNVSSQDVEKNKTQPSSFFLEQTKILSKKNSFSNRSSNTLSKLTSGKCLTDPETENNIKNHVNITVNNKRKSSSQASKNEPSQSKKICPLPGPSGVQVVPVSDSETDTDSDIPEEGKCCVCHKYQPEELRHSISLVFTSWAQCDIPDCNHWTHLVYCCNTRVVRRHDKFVCPCHDEE